MLKTNLILTLFFLYLPLKVVSQNPICPIGTYIADPTARVWQDGKLYIYGSTDDGLDHYCSFKHDVLYTPDLRLWSMQTNVFSTKGEKDAVKETDALLYAPDAMYRNNQYYLYFCTPDKNYSEGVATSKSPFGQFSEARKLNTGIYNEIDPTVFVDDDGQAYYYWGQYTLKAAKMKSNMIELDTCSIKDSILDKKIHFFHEGSFVFKHNDIYYIVYAHEGRRDYRPTCLGYATSNSPLGPFKYGGIIIDNFGCDPESWNNHGSIAEFNGQWYVFYHRSSHGSKVMRRACMEPIFFNKDGSINEVEMTSQGAGKPFDAKSKIEAERACLLNGYCRVLKINESNECIAKVKSGDKAAFKYIDFGKGVDSLTITAQSFLGATILIRTGSADGKVIGRLKIPIANRFKVYKKYTCAIKGAKGIQALWFDFKGSENNAHLLDIDNFIFK